MWHKKSLEREMGNSIIQGSVDLVKDFVIYPKNNGKPLDSFKPYMTKFFQLKRSVWIGAKST